MHRFLISLSIETVISISIQMQQEKSQHSVQNTIRNFTLICSYTAVLVALGKDVKKKILQF